METTLIENNSGQGKNITVPKEVLGHFNWGAFFLNFIWGLGNGTYITLLALLCWALQFVPGINLFSGIAHLALCIWFGIKGNEWAWQNKEFESVEAFHSYQKKWATAGILLVILLFIAAFVFGAAIFALLFSAASSAH